MAAEAEEDWSRGRELNPRPTDYESVALPLSYPGVSGSYSAVGVYHELMCPRCARHDGVQAGARRPEVFGREVAYRTSSAGWRAQERLKLW